MESKQVEQYRKMIEDLLDSDMDPDLVGQYISSEMERGKKELDDSEKPSI